MGGAFGLFLCDLCCEQHNALMHVPCCTEAGVSPGNTRRSGIFDPQVKRMLSYNIISNIPIQIQVIL
jgi:hypothetical protein